MKLFSIKQKRLLLPILLVTLPIAILAATALFSLHQTIRSMARTEVEHAILVMQDAWQNWQNQLGTTASQIADNNALLHAVSLFRAKNSNQEPILHELRRHFDQASMDELLVTDTQGRGLVTTARPTLRRFDVPLTLLGNLLTQQKPFVSLINLHDQPTWVAGAPLFDQHDTSTPSFIGTLIITRKLDAFFLKQLPQNTPYPLALWYDHTLIWASKPFFHQLTLPIQPLRTPGSTPFLIKQQETDNHALLSLAWLPIHSTQGAFLGALALGLESSLDDAGWQTTLWLILTLSTLLILVSSGLGWLHEHRMSHALAILNNASAQLMDGKPVIRVPEFAIAEIATLGQAFNEVAARMEQQQALLLHNQWLQEGITLFHKILGKNVELIPLCNSTVTFLTTFLEGILGAFYVVKEDGTLRLLASHGYQVRKISSNLFIPGEGLVGQVLLEKKHLIITRVPDDYILVQSGLGEARPQTLLIFPFLLHHEVVAIAELATLTRFTDNHLLFLSKVAESVSMAVTAAIARNRTQETMEQLREQRQVMEQTSQALRHSNTTLAEQKQALQLSQAQLLEQQEELRVSNEELEEQAQLLEEQKQAADQKNAALLTAQKELQRHTKELQMANRYKSEFLSNMSHELRTPLNSLLILAKSFVDNEEHNLYEQQISDARIIYESGSELLQLINEILDLSKIEAGRMTVTTEWIDLPTLAADIIRRFKPMAADKGLRLSLELSPEKEWQPFRTDGEKLGRIIKNLLSNAFKFTKKGGVTLRFGPPPRNWSPPEPNYPLDQAVAIAVADTGIGIPEEKRRLIFEAFQQADGSISRQFGGTGLGLTISTQLARLLRGTIQVSSEVGTGSVFTLILAPLPPSNEEPLQPAEVPAPRTRPAPTHNLEEQPPIRNKPTERLYTPPRTLQVTPRPDSGTQPQTASRALLLVEDDANARAAMMQLLRHQPIQVTQAATGREALQWLQEQPFDCIILDLGLPDINGFDLLEQMNQLKLNAKTPVIVYSGQELTREEYDRLKKHTDSIVVKGANSPKRLLNEMTLLLSKNAPETSSRSLQPKNMDETPVKKIGELKNRNILLVDDDVRNAYAMTRRLEQQQMKVHMAANGLKALEAMEKHPEIECVLMDVMMPVMDGLEAIRQLRARPESASLPIIALTAKSTDDDRRAALEAGANDYLPKPVEMNQLFDKLTTWMTPE